MIKLINFTIRLLCIIIILSIGSDSETSISRAEIFSLEKSAGTLDTDRFGRGVHVVDISAGQTSDGEPHNKTRTHL